jgi:hypothetical protein
MTVTIVPETPINMFRASSAVPWNASGEPGPMSMSDNTEPATSAASTENVGSTHSEPRRYSESASRRIIANPPSARRCRGYLEASSGRWPGVNADETTPDR